MSLALFAPGLGYYARGDRQFGAWPGSGSDFITAPELSPLFGECLAVQVRQALQAAGSRTVLEFGAGSGALALSLLGALGEAVDCYQIVDLSGSLRLRQAERLAGFGAKVQWLDRWPDTLEAWCWATRCSTRCRCNCWPGTVATGQSAAWPGTTARSPGTTGRANCARRLDADFAPGTVTELHHQAEAFIASLAERLRRGAAFFIDYGFPEAEYYHPQRVGGTLMCHRGHRADTNPLQSPGDKDITAHVDFTGIARPAQQPAWTFWATPRRPASC